MRSNCFGPKGRSMMRLTDYDTLTAALSRERPPLLFSADLPKTRKTTVV
jgi:hypothetical protein